MPDEETATLSICKTQTRAPDHRMEGFAFYDNPDRLSTILHRNCRVETLIIRYLANVSRRNLNENRNGIIVVYKFDTYANFIAKI